MPEISILTITYSRKDKLQKFLDSIISADKFKEVEVLILINGEDREIEKLFKMYSSYPNINFIKFQKKSRGETRNTLIRQAKAAILYFLDDDVIVQKNTFSILSEKFSKYKEVDIIGGPNLTPLGSGLFQRCQGYVLGSFWGTLWMSQRYRSSGIDRIAGERILILCNLAIRKRAFEKSGVLFNTHIVCAEENLLIECLVRLGYKAMFIPELIIYHERRHNYLDFCKQIFVYGRGRCQIVKGLPKPGYLIHLVPGIFLVYLITIFFYPDNIYAIPAYCYFFLYAFSSLRIAVQNKEAKAFVVCFMLYCTMHCSYGLGFIFELLNKHGPKNKK